MANQNYSSQQKYGNELQSSTPFMPSVEEGYSTYGEEEKEFIKLQIDVEPLLENFEHRVLRGEYLQINIKTAKKEWKLMSTHRIINEIGIRELMSRIMGKVSIIGRLTYKTEEEIMKDMFYFDMSITELIAKRADLWECDIEVAKALKDAAVELVWDVAAGTRNGFTMIQLRSQYSRVDSTRTDALTKSGSEQRSFLGIPLPGRR